MDLPTAFQDFVAIMLGYNASIAILKAAVVQPGRILLLEVAEKKHINTPMTRHASNIRLGGCTSCMKRDSVDALFLVHMRAWFPLQDFKNQLRSFRVNVIYIAK